MRGNLYSWMSSGWGMLRIAVTEKMEKYDATNCRCPQRFTANQVSSDWLPTNIYRCTEWRYLVSKKFKRWKPIKSKESIPLMKDWEKLYWMRHVKNVEEKGWAGSRRLVGMFEYNSWNHEHTRQIHIHVQPTGFAINLKLGWGVFKSADIRHGFKEKMLMVKISVHFQPVEAWETSSQ